MTARQRFGGRPLRRNEHPPKRARRGDTVGSPSASRFDAGDGNLTRFGCPSLKTKFWIARVGLNMLRDTVAHGYETGNGAECGMSHRIRHKRIPLRALGEQKTKGSGTARVVAGSNHDGLLNPNRCWDSVRRKSVGRPTRTSVSRDFRVERCDVSARDVSVKAPPVSPKAHAGG